MLNKAEVKLIEWQYGLGCGSFTRKLFDLFTISDGSNLDALAKGFPDEVQAYRRYVGESGYWDRIQELAGKEGVL